MKREILFKGKRFDNGQWVVGDLIQLDGRKMIAGLDMTAYDNGDVYCNVELRCIQVHPNTVCQLVKDDLFEGDIIERPEHYKCTGEDFSIGKYQVVYDSENLRYALKTIKSEIFKEGSIVGFHGQLTKIGNIHDETH